MPNILCPQSTPCENPANPTTNYSSEAPDKEVFLGFGSSAAIDAPNPGTPYTSPFGYYYCSSLTSQEAADLCGANGAVDNTVDSGGTSNNPPPNTATDPGAGNQVFWNDAQSFTVTCPDGGSFTYTMPAMSVRAQSPSYANTIALSLAQIRANRYVICISNISGACLNEEYDQLITASTQTTGDIDWQLRSGSLPPGITMLPNLFNTRQISLAGTPTVAGNYSFVIRATDDLGNFTDKAFTLAILGITNSPSAATVGTPYSFQFTAAGGTAPYTFSVPPANLPDGLSMNEGGLITGTPTSDVETVFTVTIEDDAGNVCGEQFTMTPTAGCSAIVPSLVWTIQDNGAASGGSGSFAYTTDTFLGGSLYSGQFDLVCTITNNTNQPFDIKFDTLQSAPLWAAGTVGYFFVAIDGSNVLFDNTNWPDSPFTDRARSVTVTIPANTSATIEVGGYHEGPQNQPTNGSFTITCV